MIALPLQLFVALDAEIHAELKVGQAFLVRSVRFMAAQAVDREVLVPLVYCLFSYRVGRMMREIVTGTAESNDVRPIQQEDIIGGMRRMAGRAHPLLHGNVLGNCLVLLRNRVLVTTAAKARHRGAIQEGRLLRCVRIMTVQTAPAVDQGPVNPVLRQCRIDHIVVASAAELKAGILGLERRR
jgi:hypothetical protein